MGPRRGAWLRARLRLAAVVMGALGLAVMPTAAHAGLLGGLLGGVTKTVTKTTGALVETTTGVVGGTLEATTGLVGGTLDATTGLVGGTLDATTGLVGGTLGATTGLLGGTVEALLGTTVSLVESLGLIDTGWLYDEATTTMEHVAEVVGADKLWRVGITGRGVDVAVIDTGIAAVDGLIRPTVLNGPDLSFDSQVEPVAHLDTFGHGTHIAGIIAGRGAGFRGIAPDAGIVSIKAGAVDGSVDVSQIIAAIDWVVTHGRRDGLNIRVINLSYGTDSTQDYRVDPLARAVENAWRHGIVVVASGGNSGSEAPTLTNPAFHPGIIAVGAADTRGTASARDDVVPAFSTRGAAQRPVDLVAPGRSIASLRSPGSYIDQAHPDARVGEHLLKGSGSSQASAVVSGAAALLLQQRPHLTPAEVKALLRSSAEPMPAADAQGRGAGMLDVAAAAVKARPRTAELWTPSSGTGALHGARGSGRVADAGVDLEGERTILGPWQGAAWRSASATGRAWVGGRWVGDGATWTADCWCGQSWTRRTWAPAVWQGASWGGVDWTSHSWRGDDWDSHSWRSHSWRSHSWRSHSWRGAGWSSLAQ